MTIRFLITSSYFILFCNITFISCINQPPLNNTVNTVNTVRPDYDTKTYVLTENEVALRSGPGEQFKKIINEKASQVTHQTEYKEIDKSVTVVIEEAKDQWVKIRVKEPEWLRESHVGWIPAKFLIEPGQVPVKKVKKSKLLAFNDIPTLRQRLSQNGIGPLYEWRSDDAGGYMSITSYFRFGTPSPSNGLENNLSYYLESDNDQYVRTLSLVLNIFNATEKKEALKKMSIVVGKTFGALSQPVPTGLLKAICNGAIFNKNSGSYELKFSLEESRIETWKVVITTK